MSNRFRNFPISYGISSYLSGEIRNQAVFSWLVRVRKAGEKTLASGFHCVDRKLSGFPVSRKGARAARRGERQEIFQQKNTPVPSGNRET